MFRHVIAVGTKVILFSLSLVIVLATVVLDVWICLYGLVSVLDVQNLIPAIDGIAASAIVLVSLVELALLERAITRELDLTEYIDGVEKIVLVLMTVTVSAYFVVSIWLFTVLSRPYKFGGNIGNMLLIGVVIYLPLFIYAVWHESHQYVGIHLEHRFREDDR